MQVQISDTAIVVPSTPRFSDHHILPLTHPDNDANLRVTFRYVRAYVTTTTTNSSSDPFHVISAAATTASSTSAQSARASRSHAPPLSQPPSTW
ncbi:hypothetical protein ACLB2K_005989 [Fragaria x ananassa]